MGDVKLTEAMRRWLQNLADGREGCAGLRGMSAAGGSTRTVWAIAQRDLIDRETGEITDAGGRALQQQGDPT